VPVSGTGDAATKTQEVNHFYRLTLHFRMNIRAKQSMNGDNFAFS
jgi:hypothetical protein